MEQHNIPGRKFVDELAEYLVELHTQSEQFDKGRIKYLAQDQEW